ncbi:MAG: extracellular solute-binding protein [Oscillibacter sp.]|nr:extracellular solute-binding protein [Oscillibacter sp.]
MLFLYFPKIRIGRQFRLLALCLALCLALDGCGASVGVEAPSSGQGEADTRTEASEAGTEIAFWYAAGATGAAVMEEIVDGFNRSQEQYRVKTRVFGSYTEITNQVQAAIATGTAPDVVVLERDVSLDFHNRGLTADLTEVFAGDPRFAPERFLSVYYDQGIAPDGCLYAMPLYGATQVLYYNKAAFRAAGIDPESVRTWQDLSEAAKTIQAAGLCQYGWEPMWGYENMLDAALSNGGTVFSEDGRTVTVNTPEWVEVWEAFRRWLHEERTMRIHSGGLGWEYWDYTRLDALEGRAGGYTGSSGDQADVDFDIVGMLEQPGWKIGDQAQPEAKALLMNVLTASARERRQGAYALVRTLADVPAQARWSIGTGYIAVNQGVLEDESYQSYLADHAYVRIPLNQSTHAAVYPADPTGGVLRDALIRAADRVQIENLSAQDALDEAQRTAQRALDSVLARDQAPLSDHHSSTGRVPDSVTRATVLDTSSREGVS